MQPQQQDLLQADDLHGMLHIRDSLGAESGFLQLTLIKQALQLHHKVSSCACAGAGQSCWLLTANQCRSSSFSSKKRCLTTTRPYASW